MAEGFVVYYNYDYTTAKRKSGDVDVSIKMLDTSCTKEATGILPDPKLQHVIKTPGTKTIWGRASDSLLYSFYGYYPEHTACADSSPTLKGTFGYCSEHKGKTVLICVSQQKDNFPLAKKIFDSFKWSN